MSGRTLTVLSLLVLAASGAVYLPSLSGEYIYDDHRFVVENAAVGRGAGVLEYFTDPATQTADESWQGLYRPLRTLSWRGTAMLAEGPVAQRVVNLAIHLVNVVLVWLLLRSVLGREKTLPTLMGALAFSLHPLASESVAWISSRGDLLAMTGMLVAVLLHRAGHGLAAAGAFLLALLAKESAIVTPLLIAVLDGYDGGMARIRSRWKEYAVQAVVLTAFIGVRQAVLGAEGFGQGAVRPETLIERVSTILTGGLYYLWTTLFPAGLSFELRILRGVDARILSMVSLLVGTFLIGGAFVMRARGPRVSMAILWFFAALIPVTVLQLAFPLKIAVANRFAYPALVGFGVLLALFAGRGRVFAGLAGAVLLTFLPLTAARAEVWSTREKLWTDVVEKDPENAIAHHDLGRLALAAGESEKARQHLARSVAVDPRHPQVHALLGEVYEQLAQAQEKDSPERRACLARAFNAYNAGVRMWQAGIREDQQLYGMTS